MNLLAKHKTQNMDKEVQLQIEYGPGRVQKFKIPDVPCTYQEFICDIQCRIPILRNIDFGVKYLDDEDTWIIMYSDMCVEEAFRCARTIAATNFRRLKIQTYVENQPPVETKKEETQKELVRNIANKSATVSSPCPLYKTPMQILIDELEDSVNIKKVELESAHEHLAQLELKYSNPGLKPDKTKGQCGQCNLRLGHTKRNYDYGVCEGPHICGDIDKHDIEKKQLLDASQNVKTLNRDLEKLKQSLVSKKEIHRETCQSFFSQVIPHLVNTNIDKYYPVGSFGLRALNMTAVQPDIAILEKYYRGKVPRNLEVECVRFQNIIKDNQTEIDLKNFKDPVRSFMEKKGVSVPSFPPGYP